MTSVIGIKINQPGKSYILLASDTQFSIYSGKTFVEKGNGTKIWCGDWGAIARSGGEEDSNELEEFKNYFKSSERSRKERLRSMLEKAMTVDGNGERIFEEVANMNRRLHKSGSSYNDLYDFVLALRKPEPSLWYVDAYGNIMDYGEVCKAEDRKKSVLEHICIGSGSKKIERYIKKQLERTRDSFNPETAKTSAGFFLVRYALRQAERDANTGGCDIVSVTEKNVQFYGKRIRERLEKEEEDELENIAEDLDTEFENPEGES